MWQSLEGWPRIEVPFFIKAFISSSQCTKFMIARSSFFNLIDYGSNRLDGIGNSGGRLEGDVYCIIGVEVLENRPSSWNTMQ